MFEDFYHYLTGDPQAILDPKWITQNSHLACQNGILDLNTLTLKDNTQDIFTTFILPYNYDPHAECPRFKRFLEEVFEDDDERIQFTQEAMGYVLYPRLPVPGLFFLVGEGSNGKSVLLSVLENLVSTDNFCSLNLRQICESVYAIELMGKLLNAINESPSSCNKNIDILKAIVAGDYISAKALYKNSVKFKPIAKHFISLNQYPEFCEQTFATERRYKIIEFNRIFREKDQDRHLKETLLTELPGILNFTLEGLRRLKMKDFSFSSLSDHGGHDGVGKFVEQKRLRKEFPIGLKELYEDFQVFCRTHKITNSLVKRSFKSRLFDLGFQVKNSTTNNNKVLVFDTNE